jgi:hypothetical protein
MANDDDPNSDEGVERPQDPLVRRLRPDPSQPPEQVQTLEGLLGDSDRPGFRRLYFTAALDHYAGFRAEDVLSIAEIAPDQPPFLGEVATRVTLRRDATVDFTRTRSPRPVDEFDLDVRLAAGATPLAADDRTFGPTCNAECGGGLNTLNGCEQGTEFTVCAGPITVCRGVSCDGTCREATCVTCATCRTCRTCSPTCRATCGPTCRTCRTACETCAATCVTCATACGQTCGPTCWQTCITCGQGCVTVGVICKDRFTRVDATCLECV